MCDDFDTSKPALGHEPADLMKLPHGKTCADCVHFKRCTWLIGAAYVNNKATRCDFSPSRFVEGRVVVADREVP